jgi:hypothetical protein
MMPFDPVLSSNEFGGSAVDGGLGAVLEVKRATGPWTDRARKYELRVDGEAVARLRPGDVARIQISPGVHRVRVHIDWATSREVIVTVGQNETARFVCRPRATVFSHLFWTTVGRSRYVRLEERD